jgi:hypothetical protein
MCFGGGSDNQQPTPPAPTPPPPLPTASVAQTAPKTDATDNDSLNANRVGRRALRIDTTAPTATGGSGLNIPT